MQVSSISTSDIIALGALLIAAAGFMGVAYRAVRERLGVTISASRSKNGPFFITELQFPTDQTPACVSRVGFPISIVISNGRSTPLLVSSVEMEYSADGADSPVGGIFRHLEKKGDVIEVSEPIQFPHQIASHDALVLSGVFQVAIPYDTGLPLFRLYCSKFSEEKMKQMIKDLESHVVKTVDLSPMGVKLVEMRVPQMSMNDQLFRDDETRTIAKPKFGVIPLGSAIPVLGYCQKHDLPVPETEVPTRTRLVAKFANRKSVVHTFKHSSAPLWFLFRNED
jgi:hypothetical protein